MKPVSYGLFCKKLSAKEKWISCHTNAVVRTSKTLEQLRKHCSSEVGTERYLQAVLLFKLQTGLRGTQFRSGLVRAPIMTLLAIFYNIYISFLLDCFEHFFKWVNITSTYSKHNFSFGQTGLSSIDWMKDDCGMKHKYWQAHLESKATMTWVMGEVGDAKGHNEWPNQQ